MSLFSAVSAEDIRAAQIVTAATMAGFIAVSVFPGLRRYAGTIRLALLAGYLVACVGFVGVVLLR